jgi:N utilization substance protein B
MTISSSAPLSARRRKARHYIVQALYQWQLAKARPADIEAEFRSDNDMTHVDMDYFHDLLTQTTEQAAVLDQQIAPAVNGKSMKELDPVTLALLRMATCELKNRIDVPYKVVINEAVALAKKFGPTDAYKFINATLDTLAESLRPAEVSAPT